MRRVIPLELVGFKKLDCNLYDEQGQVIYNCGSDLTPELLMKLNHIKVYKKEKDFFEIINEEPETIAKRELTPTEQFIESVEPQNLIKKAEYKPVINEKTVNRFLDTSKGILRACELGIAPNYSTCVDTSLEILNEVFDKLDKVSNIAEMRIHDFYTYTHCINTAIISAIIGKEIGMKEDQLKDLTLAAVLHDVGKINIPKEILYKPDGLSKDEFSIVKNHTIYGYDLILNKIKLPDFVAKVALEHHERFDGKGYPYGLNKDKISYFAQIVAIADVYDALVSEKIYRGAVQSIDAIRIMLKEESTSFNPEIFNKFAYLAVVKNVKYW